MDTTPPDRLARGMFAPKTDVAARASFPRRRLLGPRPSARHEWEASMMVPSVFAASGGLRARPVSPLGYGMLCPYEVSCTMSADVLCHNPPIPCKGSMDALLRPHTSEPARSRWALPCAVRRAMLSFCEAALPNVCEKSCPIFLTIGSKSVTIITWRLSKIFGRSSAVLSVR
jgi:hypothetical protein